MSPLMRSPRGEEREIVPAGVSALTRLGWALVEKSGPAEAPAEKKAATRKRAAKKK